MDTTSSTASLAHKRFDLPPTISSGILNIPSPNGPHAKRTLEELVEKDRELHHCYWDAAELHNHMSHHLLAAYDLGASAELLQAIYDHEKGHLVPIDAVIEATNAKSRESGTFQIHDDSTVVDESNWTKLTGTRSLYPAYTKFFVGEIKTHGIEATLNKFLFSEEAMAEGVQAHRRLTGGVVHPFIQLGYGLEFQSEVMVAQALGQTFMHDVLVPASSLFSTPPSPPPSSAGVPLLHVLRKVYDSSVLVPGVPTSLEAQLFLSRHRKELWENGQADEIAKLSALWWSSSVACGDVTTSEIQNKIEELIWFTTLLLGATAQQGEAKPRRDFFFMHMLNSAIFLPSFARYVSNRDMVVLLDSTLQAFFHMFILQGRPPLDLELAMSYTDSPLPRVLRKADAPEAERQAPHALAWSLTATNPWYRILQDALHVPEPHVQKTIRLLYYAATRYGDKTARDIPGVFEDVESGQSGHGKETFPASARLDGSLFIRAAGWVMEKTGWLTYGEKDEFWDFEGWH